MTGYSMCIDADVLVNKSFLNLSHGCMNIEVAHEIVILRSYNQKVLYVLHCHIHARISGACPHSMAAFRTKTFRGVPLRSGALLSRTLHRK